MNDDIMTWSSKTFYEGRLKAAESVKSRLLRDLEAVECNEDTEAALVLIDTTGCDEYYELVTEDEQSKANEGEAALVTLYAQQLVQSGVDPAEIAIITPYNLQVELLRLQLRDKYPTLEIRSVDGFQVLNVQIRLHIEFLTVHDFMNGRSTGLLGYEWSV